MNQQMKNWFTKRQQIQETANEDEPVLPINDPAIPFEIQAHAARFQPPATFAIDLGHSEYILLADDGETLNLVYLK